MSETREEDKENLYLFVSSRICLRGRHHHTLPERKARGSRRSRCCDYDYCGTCACVLRRRRKRRRRRRRRFVSNLDEISDGLTLELQTLDVLGLLVRNSVRCNKLLPLLLLLLYRLVKSKIGNLIYSWCYESVCVHIGGRWE
jgi:hypothetical protein